MALPTAEVAPLPQAPARIARWGAERVRAAGGDWPRTTRVLPWALSGFLAMLWLVPFDSVALPITLPVDSRLDRFAVIILVGTWIIAALGARELGPRPLRGRVGIAILAFLIVATVSVVANSVMLDRVGEFNLAVKKLSLLSSFAVFFVVVATTVRRGEVGPFVTLTLALAGITAIGTMIEYRTGTNYFFDAARTLIPGAEVVDPPVDPEFGRTVTTGPAGHGLATATILAMALPLAWVRLSQAPDRRRQLIYFLLVAVLCAGALSTLRKTAFIAPVVALALVTVYRPREMVKLLPLGLVVVLAIQVLVPGSISSIRYEFAGGKSSGSTEGRTADYDAVTPDLVARPLLGRGYGTYDPKAFVHEGSLEVHRILDNQYLTLLIEVGLIGTLIFLCIPLTGIASLHRQARARDPVRAGVAASIIGAIGAFVVSNALFDALAFAQVPYLLFFVLGLSVAARDREPTSPQPAEDLPTGKPPGATVSGEIAVSPPEVAVSPAPVPSRPSSSANLHRHPTKGDSAVRVHPPRLLYVVGTGRCGTESIADLISALPDCRVDHERQPVLFQESIDYLEKRMTQKAMVDLLRDTRAPETSEAWRVAGESNQRLSLVLPALDEAFPDARYLWMIRDGRATVDSLHQRFWYHSREASLRPALREWAESRPDGHLLGVLEEDEWRSMDRFARCCWYWTFVNGLIESHSEAVGARMLGVRLEELDSRLGEIAYHVGIPERELEAAPHSNSTRDARRAGWTSWSPGQRASFERYAGDAMDCWYPDWRTKGWGLSGASRPSAAWRRVTSTATRRLIGAELRARRVHPATWRHGGASPPESIQSERPGEPR